MKRLKKSVWLVALSAALIGTGLPALALSQSKAAEGGKAIEVVDARGVKVQLSQSPQRIVSLLPSLTESLCALGACQRLVGVDRYSNWPAHVKTVPIVGGGLDPNIEAVFALKPDLVLVSVSSRAVTRMEALGLKVVALEPRTHAETRTVLQKLGVLLDLPPSQGADKVWAGIEAEMSKAAASVPERVRGQRVYFEASRGPFAAGETSFMGETLTRLHMRNVIEAKLGPFPRINPEYVVKADPDILMAGDRSWKTDVPEYPGWAQMRAVRQGAVCRFKPEESDILVRPGPRMAEGALIMAQCLQRISTLESKGQGSGR